LANGRRGGEFNTLVPDFMPASLEAMQESFLLGNASAPYVAGEMFWARIASGFEDLEEHRQDWDKNRQYTPLLLRSVSLSALQLWDNGNQRRAVLLKLLKHALSELQRDMKLASAVLLALCRCHDLDDVDVFRQVLVVLDTECRVVRCEFACDLSDEDETFNHHCTEWKHFLLSATQKVFIFGITCFTEEHAICLASFVRYCFLREFGMLVRGASEETVEGKRKHLLKRTVGARRRAEDDEMEYRRGDDNQQTPLDVIHSIVLGLGERARMDRNDAGTTIGASNEDLILKGMLTYQNCLRALVSIANSAIQILPQNERFYDLAGALVFAIVQCVSQFDIKVEEGGFEKVEDSENDYFVNRHEYLKDNRLIRPFRYANHISCSTSLKRDRIEQQRLLESDRLTLSVSERMQRDFVEWHSYAKPPDAILFALRGLYLRNLIDVRSCEFGYGDCLVLCRFDVTPHDPLLFW